MSGEQILVADDDGEVVQMLARYLGSEGYRVLTARDGVSALHQARTIRPDLVVLDWMMPGMTGLEVCRTLRAESRTPVIMLTARVEEPDKLIGLEVGADDYITKPFSLREVAARVRAVLRRTTAVVEDEVVIGDVTIDFSGATVSRAGQALNLTATEFKLLTIMARNPGRVYSRLQLMEAALGEYYEGYDRTIDSHISHLRRKVGGDVIQTVHGIGYKLVQPGR